MSATSAMLYKDLCQVLNLRILLSAQSRFKIAFVFVFAVSFEVGLWLLFAGGFKFLSGLGGVGIILVSKLLAVFFLGMGMMLVVSGMVTSYATIYRSREIPFLLVRPFSMSQIVVYKFIESAGLSSWAFFFIVIPFTGAYGWHEGMPWLFALWTVLFSVPFLIICSGVGTLAAMAIVRWAPRGRALRLVGAGVFIALAAWLWQEVLGLRGPGVDFRLSLARLVPGLRLASNRLLPSYWTAEGIMLLARASWPRGLLFWALASSTALVTAMAVEAVGRRTFYEGWQRTIASRGRARCKPVLLAGLERMLSWLPHDVRALVMKDIRTFLRDPMQWTQVLIFFGLLGLYYANLRVFHYHSLPENWRNAIAFLNVFSVSAVVCSLGARFIYPQLSLEGQGFWIIGLSPTTMQRVLLTKFAAAAVPTLVLSVGLMLLSSSMLNASGSVRLLAVSLACAVSLAICGLSTGLGAIFLDLDQRNPAAVVSGFGGTLNLVLGLAFVLAVILPVGFVFHMRMSHGLTFAQFRAGSLLAFAWVVLVTVASTVIPLVLATRSLAGREF